MTQPSPPLDRRWHRHGPLRRFGLLCLIGVMAGAVVACGRSSNVRYPDGSRYYEGDFPNSRPSAPTSSLN